MIDRWCHGTKPYRTDLYDRDPVNPKLSVLNASITEASVKINDLPVSSFSASAIRQDVILSISYSHPNPVGTTGHIPFHFVIFYADGHPYFVARVGVSCSSGEGFPAVIPTIIAITMNSPSRPPHPSPPHLSIFFVVPRRFGSEAPH